MSGSSKMKTRDVAEIGAAFLILLGLLIALNELQFLPQNFAVSEGMGYGLAFVIGLVASVSTCMAVTGGLLLAVMGKYSAATTGISGAQRMKPLLFFNAGRLVSYTLLGGVIGAIGSAFILSPVASGILTLIVSAVMIVLGLRMLGLFPRLTRFLPTLPTAFAHKLQDMAERRSKGGAFVLGAATFFLPCGFTQALQLYVLAKGDFATGALTMFFFALGTLPALLSLSAFASFATGATHRRFLRLAGAAVIVLGVLNIQYGWLLSRSMVTTPAPQTIAVADGPVTMQPDGTQLIEMTVSGYDYAPNHFTVQAGTPVQWRIDAREAAGCGRLIMAPALGVRELLSDEAPTTITFTPEEAGEFVFNCGMGMMTPGSHITVVSG